MDTKQLFSGIGIVVDDQVFNEKSGDKIIRIVKDLEKKGFPLAKYDDVPKVDVLNLCRCSFLLLDWELVSLSDEGGIPIPIPDLSKDKEWELIDFLKEVLSESYFPIFIFSNNAEMYIKGRLKAKGIKIEEDNLPIFIKHKGDIVTEGNVKVLDTIREWVDMMPPIYILKVWENAIEQAKIQAFLDFSKTKSWPSILWETACEDSVNPQEELMDVITQNIIGRIHSLPIEKAQLDKAESAKPTREEILTVLSTQRFNSHPNKELSGTGDFYKLEDGKYYVNIRPMCDCVARQGVNHVYLLLCDKLTNKKVSDLFDTDYGIFSEKSNEAIVGPIMNNRFYSIRFKELCVIEYDKIIDHKVGRILAPFIRHITERYALYIQRQGLPRIPIQAILDHTTDSTDNKKTETHKDRDSNCFECFKKQLCLLVRNIKTKCTSICYKR